MNRQSALRRLRSCLRLSTSANVNEAATALRQAQKLMAEYNLTESDIDVADVSAFSASTRSRGRSPGLHITRLAQACADAFRCFVFVNADWHTTTIEFVGFNADSEVASYAFSVLRRQLERDVSKHTRRIRKRSNKMKRSVAFGLGWVYAVSEKLLPNSPSSKDLDIFRAFNAARGMETITIKSHHKGIAENDVYAGVLAGNAAQLHPGMRQSPLAIGAVA